MINTAEISDFRFIPGTWKNLAQVVGEFRDAAGEFYRTGGYEELNELLECYAGKVTATQFVHLFTETFKTIRIPYVLDFCDACIKANLFKCVDKFRRHSLSVDYDLLADKELDRAQYEVNRRRNWINICNWWNRSENLTELPMLRNEKIAA